VLNPEGFESAYAHFGISGPVHAPPESNIPDPVSNENLRIEGNVIWNGGHDKPVLDQVEKLYGLTAFPTADASELQRLNQINTLCPQLMDPERGDCRPAENSNLFSLKPVTLDDFKASNGPVPAGELDNSVTSDRSGKLRQPDCVGAYT
jgi:hypothetical protein